MGGLAASCDSLYGARDGVAWRERVLPHREMHFILRGRVAWRCRVSPHPAMVLILRADLVGLTTTGSYATRIGAGSFSPPARACKAATVATALRFTIHLSPFTPHAAFFARRCENGAAPGGIGLTIHHSPVTCPHPRFTYHRSRAFPREALRRRSRFPERSALHRSPLTIHHSPLTCHLSPVTIHPSRAPAAGSLCSYEDGLWAEGTGYRRIPDFGREREKNFDKRLPNVR
jgi:hypothetical protein